MRAGGDPKQSGDTGTGVDAMDDEQLGSAKTSAITIHRRTLTIFAHRARSPECHNDRSSTRDVSTS